MLYLTYVFDLNIALLESLVPYSVPIAWISDTVRKIALESRNVFVAAKITIPKPVNISSQHFLILKTLNLPLSQKFHPSKMCQLPRKPYSQLL